MSLLCVCVQFGRGQVLETLPYHSDMRAKVSGKLLENPDIRNSGGKQAGVCFGNCSTGTSLTDSERGKSCVTADQGDLTSCIILMVSVGSH